MKKTSSRLRCAAFAAAIMTAFSLPRPVFADGLLTEPPSAEAAASPEELPARSAILMDAESGAVLFEKNAREKTPPASITKIMTLLLTLEAIEAGAADWKDPVICSPHAASMGGSQIWLKPGEEMTLEELFKAAAVNSANDASMALAEHIAGSEEAFVQRMNSRAAELGMTDTAFQNPTGLDADGHLSSARDVALMSRELLRHPDITRYTTIWTDSLRDGKTALTNTNRLVRFYKGCTGLKTGTTNGAGSCLSASASRDGVSLIAVTMGSPTSDQRFAACRALLDHGFACFESFTPEIPKEELRPIPVSHGTAESVPLSVSPISPILIPKGQSAAVSRTVELELEAAAPVEAGAQLGEAVFSLNGKELAKIPIRAACGVPRMGLKHAFFLLLERMFC